MDNSQKPPESPLPATPTCNVWNLITLNSTGDIVPLRGFANNGPIASPTIPSSGTRDIIDSLSLFISQGQVYNPGDRVSMGIDGIRVSTESLFSFLGDSLINPQPPSSDPARGEGDLRLSDALAEGPFDESPETMRRFEAARQTWLRYAERHRSTPAANAPESVLYSVDSFPSPRGFPVSTPRHRDSLNTRTEMPEASPSDYRNPLGEVIVSTSTGEAAITSYLNSPEGIASIANAIRVPRSEVPSELSALELWAYKWRDHKGGILTNRSLNRALEAVTELAFELGLIALDSYTPILEPFMTYWDTPDLVLNTDAGSYLVMYFNTIERECCSPTQF